MDNTITEGHSLRFSSPSRTQLAKANTYFDIHKRQRGLGKVKVSLIQGMEGSWFFDVSSNEENQFLDPGKLNNILPADVTVTANGPPVDQQNASQDDRDEIRSTIREMVESKLKESRATV